MAYKTVATRWLLSLRPSLPISFVEHKWGQPNITDIEVQINADGAIFSGRGSEKIGDLALEKASSEAIERWCCYKLGLPTIGCAVHSDGNAAKRNAESEFVERFIFDSFIENGGPSRKIHQIILPYGEVRFWEVNSQIVVAVAFTNENPISVGIANENTVETAIEKAKLEAVRNLAAFHFDPTKFRTAIEDDQNFWCCDSIFLKRAIERLENPQPQIISVVPFSSGVKLAGSILGYADCELYFAQAQGART